MKQGNMPNGWPYPTFMSVDDEDGSLNIEWCFGEQGSQASERVMFSWEPEVGPMACHTRHEGQVSDESDMATRSLVAYLRDAQTRHIHEDETGVSLRAAGWVADKMNGRWGMVPTVATEGACSQQQAQAAMVGGMVGSGGERVADCAADRGLNVRAGRGRRT